MVEEYYFAQLEKKTAQLYPIKTVKKDDGLSQASSCCFVPPSKVKHPKMIVLRKK